jgi:hypothetical protein
VKEINEKIVLLCHNNTIKRRYFVSPLASA